MLTDPELLLIECAKKPGDTIRRFPLADSLEEIDIIEYAQDIRDEEVYKLAIQLFNTITPRSLNEFFSCIDTIRAIRLALDGDMKRTRTAILSIMKGDANADQFNLPDVWS